MYRTVIAAEANPIGADQVRHMDGHDCSDGRHRKAFRHHHLVLGVHVGAISVAGTVSSPRMIEILRAAFWWFGRRRKETSVHGLPAPMRKTD
jgi:hypothetical protein